MVKFLLVAAMSILLAASSAGPVQAPSVIGFEAIPTVIIKVIYDGPCAGICPNFEVTVGSDGGVAALDRYSGEVERYRANPIEHLAFSRIMRKLRWFPRPKVTCPLPGGRKGYPTTIEVRWSDGSSPERLLTCREDTEVYVTLQDALLALGASPRSGRKLTSSF